MTPELLAEMEAAAKARLARRYNPDAQIVWPWTRVDDENLIALVTEMRRMEAALIDERRTHRWHMAAIPAGPNFIPQYVMDEKWPDLTHVALGEAS